MEHLTFRGSRHVAPLDAMRIPEAVGATDWNAETSSDTTMYHAVYPASRLGLALWLESERMAFTLEAMTPEGFELERKVVLQEMRLRGGDSGYGRHLLRAMYPEGHPYRPSRRPFGDTTAITFDGARGFFQRAYRPSNARLVVVGDFRTERARDQIERYFGPLGAPLDYYSSVEARVAALRPVDLQAAAARWLDTTAAQVALAGRFDQQMMELEALGKVEIQRLREVESAP